jgi:hypothetical protein
MRYENGLVYIRSLLGWLIRFEGMVLFRLSSLLSILEGTKCSINIEEEKRENKRLDIHVICW